MLTTGRDELAPTDAAGVAEAVRAARSGGMPVWIRGAGTKESGVPRGPGLLLRTTGLKSSPDIRPANLTATLSAGMPLAEVNRLLEPHGLFYPMTDIALGATVGGSISAGVSGPWRLGYGLLRDWVLGFEFVTAAGDVIRTGRPTMKNVSGYNLTRLICGAWGTLGVITGAILRLSPVPPAHGSIAAGFPSAAGAVQALLPLLRSAPLPMAAEWLSEGGAAGTLLLRFAGEEGGVAEKLAEARQALAGSATSLESVGGETAAPVPPDPPAWADRQRQVRRLLESAPVRFRLGVPPGKLAAAAALAQAPGLSPAWLTGHLGSGVLTVGLAGPPPVAALQGLRARAAAEWGGYLALEAGPPDLAAALAPAPSRAAAAVRAALAPGACFNPDRQL